MAACFLKILILKDRMIYFDALCIGESSFFITKINTLGQLQPRLLWHVYRIEQGALV